MLIDWFTIGAQALNFLVLVWLLKHFLYKPILNAIDAREKRIVAELASATTAKAEAQKDRDEFQQKNQKFDGERAALMSKATDDAKAQRQHLIDEAAKAADAAGTKRRDETRSDTDRLRAAIARRAQQEVFAITREALTDLANTTLEERMIDVFTHRLQAMSGDDKKRFGDALKSAPAPSVVRTAFELPAGPRAIIQTALNQTFSADIHLAFETAPDLIGGIELTAAGQKLAWSITDYLTSLHAGIDELVAGEQITPPPRPDTPSAIATAKS